MREFVERSLKPRAEQFIAARSIDRVVWVVSGMQGLPGLEVPEAYGGSAAGDFRFNAVMAEELSKFNAAASSSFGIHTDGVAPYLVELGPRSRSSVGSPASAPARSSPRWR